MTSLLSQEQYLFDSENILNEKSHLSFSQLSSHLIESFGFDPSLKFFFEHTQGRNNSHKNIFSFVKQSQSLDNNTDYYSLHCDASTYYVDSEENCFYTFQDKTSSIESINNKYHSRLDLSGKPNSVLAGIIRLNDQDFLSYRKALFCHDSNVAELLAILEGLQLAQSLHIKNLSIYTDSSVSITFIRKHFQLHHKYMKNEKFIPLTSHILESLQFFESCHFIHVPRKQNKEADKLTRMKLHLR